MIVWGSRGDVINFGPQDARDCVNCEKSRPFDLIMQYRYGGLYWVFNFVMEKKYLLLCQTCGRGWELQDKQVEGKVKMDSVPFMRRYGLAMLGAVIVLVILTNLGGDSKQIDDQLRNAPASAPAATTPEVAHG